MKLLFIGTEAELKKLRDDHEKAELERRRKSLEFESLDDAKKRFESLTITCDTALHALEDAYATYDETGDWETDKKNADYVEKLEREFSRLIRQWENIRIRIARERRGTDTPDTKQ